MHRRDLVKVLSGAIAVLGLTGADTPAMAGSASVLESIRVPGVRVMTQNLYIGLDVFPITAAPLDQLPVVVADAYADFVANRPADRMAAVANEIAVLQPHLIGLQEVVRVFEQSPSDAIAGNLSPNATDEVVDFLAVLLDELRRRGLDYEVAAEQVGADLELPRLDGFVDGEPVFSDVRSRFSDVILRRAGVVTAPLFAINYAASLPVATLPGDVAIERNAVAVLANVDGNTFRFVSTHVEPLVPGLADESQPQLAQVRELTSLLATAHEPSLPTVVVGDFNSPAASGASYQLMTDAGYTDVWTVREPLGQTGLTCCQDVVLSDPASSLSERIDFVWTSNLTLSSPVLAFTIGDQAFSRTWTRPRLWPSDHAGVAALLLF